MRQQETEIRIRLLDRQIVSLHKITKRLDLITNVSKKPPNDVKPQIDVNPKEEITSRKTEETVTPNLI